jgi:hypothetical protein
MLERLRRFVQSLSRKRGEAPPRHSASVRESFGDLQSLGKELGIDEIRLISEPTALTYDFVIAALRDLHDRGIALPAKLGFVEFRDKKTVASFFDRDDRLAVNVSAEFWSDPFGQMEQLGTEGYFSSANPHAIIYHEIGHALHRRQFESGHQWWRAASTPLNPLDRELAERVSAYAVLDAGEFVAETFAGLVAGRTFDGEVMTLYRNLKGPLP